MYLKFYELKRKPFQISTDPRFMWMGEKHKEALAMLKYGIMDNRGFIMLSGNVGTGKTTLINALINSLGPDVIVANITDPGLYSLDFFNLVGDAFNFNTTFATKREFLTGFRSFLEKSFRDGKQVLLVIDEAQRLSQKMLEEIRLLSNIERQDRKLLNIFFVGQDELNEIIDRHENRALRQRLTLQYHLESLSETEIDKYIQHRLKVAGCTGRRIFSKAAVSEIKAFSEGYPRLVNIICDHALLTGYVSRKKTINASQIRECAGDLKLTKTENKLPPPVKPIRETEPADNSPNLHKKRTRRRIFIFLTALFLILFSICFLYFPIKAGMSLSEIPGYWHYQANRYKYALKLQDMQSPLSNQTSQITHTVTVPKPVEQSSKTISPETADETTMKPDPDTTDKKMAAKPQAEKTGSPEKVEIFKITAPKPVEQSSKTILPESPVTPETVDETMMKPDPDTTDKKTAAKPQAEKTGSPEKVEIFKITAPKPVEQSSKTISPENPIAREAAGEATMKPDPDMTDKMAAARPQGLEAVKTNNPEKMETIKITVKTNNPEKMETIEITVPKIDEQKSKTAPPENPAPVRTIAEASIKPDWDTTDKTAAARSESRPEAVKTNIQDKGEIIESERYYLLSFGFDSNKIPAESYGRLDRTAALMNSHPRANLTITGHTDTNGNESHNFILSILRAEIVKNYLIKRGVAPDRITTIGKGGEEPIASNDEFLGRRANRRVEVEMIFE